MISFSRKFLTEEHEKIVTAIKKEPTKAAHRMALASLRLMTGDYKNALQQIQVACQISKDLEPQAQLIRMLIQAENLRASVFKGKCKPDLISSMPKWLEAFINVLNNDSSDFEEEKSLIFAKNQAPEVAGSLNDNTQPFSWMVDGDDRLGPILEIFLGNTYYWVPFDQIEHVSFEDAKDVSDILWQPISLKLINHAPRSAFMPTRYPKTEKTQDVLKENETVWVGTNDKGWIGHGQRIWFADGEEILLSSLKNISFKNNL
jgi:type VI secretion system protein ImpE